MLATAYDLTGDAKYRDGVLQGMDYILGRNALNQSYVTGWGEVARRTSTAGCSPTSSTPSLPNPPAGSLAGGANAGIEDPFAQSNCSTGCKPSSATSTTSSRTSTNEVAINWNSALAWVASFLADQDKA